MAKLISIIFLITITLNSAYSLEVDIPGNFISPWTEESARPALYTAGALAVATIFLKAGFEDHLQSEIYKHKVLNNTWAHIGTDGLQIYPNILYTLIYGGLWLNNKENSDYLRRSYSMFNATLYAGAIANIFKPLYHERRPNGGKWSFPSGHASTAFSFAAFVAEEHPWPYGLLAYSAATLVGVSRMALNAHYPHDVLAGAAIGISYGVAQFHKQNREFSKENKSPTTQILVVPNDRFDGVTAVWLKNY